MRVYLLTFLSLLLSLCAYAGLGEEIAIFEQQITVANKILSNNFESFKLHYISTQGNASVQTVDYTTSTDPSRLSNPIAYIKFGYVDNSTIGSSCTLSTFCTAGDNIGMYAVEVVFKNYTHKPDISQVLANRAVLFLALVMIIRLFIPGSSPGFSQLADATHMSYIQSLSCKLKTKYCSADLIGNKPLTSCSSAYLANISNSLSNALSYPGQLLQDNYSSTANINFFAYVSGENNLFADCVNSYATCNDMSCSHTP